ncbi:MAG: hypothetical protein J4428_00880 [Candidatus Aenigmarchaeota archaeon]|nr:hypothetical protein [Candidatus Aenigmarchaeota archaeon]
MNPAPYRSNGPSMGIYGILGGLSSLMIYGTFIHLSNNYANDIHVIVAVILGSIIGGIYGNTR